MQQSTFGIRRAATTKGSADLRNRLRPHSLPPTNTVLRGVAASHGPRTSLIDAEWGTTDSQPDAQPDSVPVASEVRQVQLDAVSHGPRTSLIDAEWGTTDSLQSDVQHASIQVKSKISQRVSKVRSHEPRASRIDAERAIPDSQLRVQCEAVPFELQRPVAQDSVQVQVSPHSVAPRRNAAWFLWLACSIIVVGGLGFGLSMIDANRVTRWVPNRMPPAPHSLPIVMPKPPAPIGSSTPATVTPSASQAIAAHVETFSEPLVVSTKTSLKTVNRRPAVPPRKAQTMARTSRQLPSVVAFDDL